MPIAGIVARWPDLTAAEACARLFGLLCKGRAVVVNLRHPRGLHGGLSQSDLRMELVGP
ncbi:hypothetical protein [Muricoccus radiodurans]|uniref:hypothetical protein n=1 Tax=Muricoccus radiodurans TaxID=2231721 RepID=UPI003CF000CF